MADAPTKRVPGHVQLSRELGVAIVTGEYQVGEILPGELEIASRYGVSRSVVREALRMLSARGLIASKPKTGTRVRPREDWHLLDPTLLEWMFEAAPPADFVRALFELRLIVEPAAAELAAKKRSARQLSMLGHALEDMAEHKLSTERGRLADQNFHAAILEATDNELLVNLSASIGAAVRWTTHFKYRARKKPRDSIEEHRRLFQAIADNDGEAARQATVELIVKAEEDTRAALDA